MEREVLSREHPVSHAVNAGEAAVDRSGGTRTQVQILTTSHGLAPFVIHPYPRLRRSASNAPRAHIKQLDNTYTHRHHPMAPPTPFYMSQTQDRARRQNHSCAQCRKSKKACDGYVVNEKAGAAPIAVTPSSSEGSCK